MVINWVGAIFYDLNFVRPKKLWLLLPSLVVVILLLSSGSTADKVGAIGRHKRYNSPFKIQRRSSGSGV